MIILRKIIDRFEEMFCAVLLMSMLILLTIQVISRFVFNNSNSWSEEAARYLFVWFIFIAASYAFQKGAHIRIDALLLIFPKKTRKYVKKVGQVVLILFTSFITVIGVMYTLNFLGVGQVSLGLKIKMGYVYAAIPAGYFLMTLRNIAILFKNEKVEGESCQVDY